MTTNFFKLSLIALLFSFISAGCQKDDIFELDIGDENAVILKEIDGMEFKFCLLNEQGNPATIFNAGENFIFLFSFRNNLSDSIIVTTEFINNDFFRVSKINNDNEVDMGTPWTGVWCRYSGEPHEFIVQRTKIKSLKCPWVLTDTKVPDYPLCISESKDYLSTGEYLTSFNLNFHYIFNSELKIIKDKKFKINFKIN